MMNTIPEGRIGVVATGTAKKMEYGSCVSSLSLEDGTRS